MPPKKRTLQAVRGGTTVPRATVAQMALKSAALFEKVASGYTLNEAARELKIPQPQASKLFNEALASVIESDTSARAAMLERELETLRLLKKNWMDKALHGDYQAARVILQVVDRVADLAGLTQSLKVQISNQRVDATVSELMELLDNKESQIPRLLNSGVLVIEQPADDEDTAAG